jgi:hypothetical protein
MKKIDLKKDLKHLYQPSAAKAALVEVPAMNFLMIDGKGHPNRERSYRRRSRRSSPSPSPSSSK